MVRRLVDARPRACPAAAAPQSGSLRGRVRQMQGLLRKNNNVESHVACDATLCSVFWGCMVMMLVSTQVRALQGSREYHASVDLAQPAAPTGSPERERGTVTISVRKAPI